MKLILFFFGILHLAQAQAVSISVIGPCSEQPIYQMEAPLSPLSLGDFTVQAFDQNKIPYEGNRYGIKSIARSPTGDDALEILSDSEMRAYGWCVEIDGEQPGRMPDEVFLGEKTQRIVWFYAYTLYDKGTWTDFCTPSYKVKSLPACRSSKMK